jgi:hypothetical protein
VLLSMSFLSTKKGEKVLYVSYKAGEGLYDGIQ